MLNNILQMYVDIYIQGAHPPNVYTLEQLIAQFGK